MNENILIEAQNVFKSYKTKLDKVTPVLKGINLKIFRGDFIALVGPSGVGKSTLLHLLGSLDLPDEGTINFYTDSKKIDYLREDPVSLSKHRNKSIGFVFQFSHLLPEFTAIENVMLPALIAGDSFKNAQMKARELLENLDVIHRKDNKPSQLSGGEQQRIAIARALINKPDLILADEPTGNLDSDNAKIVLDIIQNLRKQHKLTFIIATHSLEVANIAQKKLMMKDGMIV
jgi:ABC-type lipoprotein export system ATPase subunit